MEKQLQLGSVAPEAVYFKPASNQGYDMNSKPYGGLWTSTWIPDEQRSEWVRWCVAEDFGQPYEERWFLLTPPDSARIYTIDRLGNLIDLLKNYPRNDVPASARNWHPLGWINWVEVALDYDAVHLTSLGNKRLHHSSPVDLNCWDVESTVWLNWVDFEVEEISVPVSVLR